MEKHILFNNFVIFFSKNISHLYSLKHGFYTNCSSLFTVITTGNDAEKNYGNITIG